MSKSFKAITALLVFIAIYFLISAIVFLIIYFTLGSPTDWRLIIVGAFANAWAAGYGVYAGRGLLDRYLAPYPSRFVGIAFIALLALWFIPLTLIYLLGAAAFLYGGIDLEGWPPEGELAEYFLGLVRAAVAVICTWVMLVKRDANNQAE
jgi:hypothetical protein